MCVMVPPCVLLRGVMGGARHLMLTQETLLQKMGAHVPFAALSEEARLKKGVGLLGRLGRLWRRWVQQRPPAWGPAVVQAFQAAS